MPNSKRHDQTTQPAKTFVRARYIAAKYSISERQVLLMAASGKIPSIRVGSKSVRFDEAAVAAVVEGVGLNAQ